MEFYQNCIEINPATMLGKPVSKGTCITVEMIAGEIKAGYTTAEVLIAHPHLSKEVIQAALQDAAATKKMHKTNQDKSSTRSSVENAAEEEKLWHILQEVKDPEVPVLSILDLGIVRNLSFEKGKVLITITPTYSGCPAMDVISMDIRLKLIEKGYRNIAIQQQLSPAWTTDWLTEEGKEKLKAFGIAPPNPKQQFCTSDMFREEAVQCPHCNAYHTELISQFSSTACKALYRCFDCKEAFDYFKCH